MTIGIGGVSRSGKSTLARLLVNHYRDSGKTAIALHQDDFVFPTNQIPRIKDKVDWEHPESINHDLLLETTAFYRERFEVVVVDGFLAFYDQRFVDLYQKKIFVEIDRSTFLARKEDDLRWGDIPRWFFDHIWDSYLSYGIPVFEVSEYLRVSGVIPYDLKPLVEWIAYE